MLVLAFVVLALCTTRLTGGRLSRLALLHWRRPWLLPLALLAQVVVVEAPGLPRALSAGVHVLTYVAAAGFVWLNRRVAGLWLLAVGAACNGITIALNGGTLPSSSGAMARAGIRSGDSFVNSGQVKNPVLPWLGDVFATPSWVPLGNVFSIGDVLIVLGAAWVIHAGARRGAGTDGPSAADETLLRQGLADPAHR